MSCVSCSVIGCCVSGATPSFLPPHTYIIETATSPVYAFGAGIHGGCWHETCSPNDTREEIYILFPDSLGPATAVVWPRGERSET